MGCVDRTAEFLDVARQCFRDDGGQGQLKTAPPTPSLEPTTAFGRAAQAVMNTISNMHDFLASQEKDYLSINQHISTTVSSMTDEQRDQLETESTQFTSVCANKIQTLEEAITKAEEEEGGAEKTDSIAHSRTVIICLYDSLKHVTMFMQHLKAIRTDRLKQQAQRVKPEKFAVDSTLPQIDLYSDSDDGSGEDDLDPMEVQEMEQENRHLMEQLNDNLDQVRQAEQKMVEIAGMLSLFSTKVLEQEAQISTIYDTAVDSTARIRSGNEQLRKALDRGVNSRVMILFVLLLASFSLLFLDWYSQF